MEKEIGKKILDKIEIVGAELGELMDFSMEIPEGKHREEFINHIADIFDILAAGLSKPIVKQYPELDPDKEYFENKKNQ